jgi:hypothetical protein
MAQHFLVDRRWAGSYLAIIAGACMPGAVGPVVPANAPLAPPELVSQWAAPSVPEGHQLLKFRWQIQDDRGAAGGRGSARIAAPDSVRLDVAGPLGSGRGAAVVVSDSAQWTDPPDVIQRLVPSYPLMWAMFGVMRRPPRGAVVRGVADSSGVQWEWSRGADTVRYDWRRTGPHLLAEARRAGQVVGRVETSFGGSSGVARSQLLVPDPATKLTITFSGSQSTEPFPPDLWLPPQP